MPPDIELHPNRTLSTFYNDLFDSGFFVFNDEEPHFQEKLVQIIWNEQLVNTPLTTVAGDLLQIFHAGIWNVESGPDFHDAAIAVNDQLQRGAIEIHLQPEDWFRHHHDGNPDYNGTILHVVWSNPKHYLTFPENIPLCVLQHQISLPLPELLTRIDLSLYPYASKIHPGNCARHFAELSDEHIANLLQSYGVARVLEKSRAISEEILRNGLEQTVYYRFLDILGYKNNRPAFQRLAERMPVHRLNALTGKNEAMAVLFGAAGLLPDPTRTAVLPQHQRLVRELWDAWWPHRRGCPDIHWNRHRLRPYNWPERRLIAAHLILRDNSYRLGRNIIQTMRRKTTPQEAVRQLHRLLGAAADASWHSFYDFTRTLEKPASLLGEHRVQDFIVNLAIPLFFADCMMEQSAAQCEQGKQILLQVPKLQDNRLLKEAIHHFFMPPSRARDVVSNACAQQGLLQLYRDFHPGS